MTRQLFRAVAFAEALSWAGLLVGMAIKYLGSGDTTGVRIFGALHGGVFIAYVLVSLVAARTFRWSLITTLLALAASLPPFFTFLFEMIADRKGLLHSTR